VPLEINRRQLTNTRRQNVDSLVEFVPYASQIPWLLSLLFIFSHISPGSRLFPAEAFITLSPAKSHSPANPMSIVPSSTSLLRFTRSNVMLHRLSSEPDSYNPSLSWPRHLNGQTVLRAVGLSCAPRKKSSSLNDSAPVPSGGAPTSVSLSLWLDDRLLFLHTFHSVEPLRAGFWNLIVPLTTPKSISACI
jgi:hypothetical protein